MPDSTGKSPRSAYWQAFSLAGEMGFTIAVPLVVFGLAGRYADHVLKTTPWMFLLGLALAIGASTILLIRKFTHILRDITNNAPDHTTHGRSDLPRS